jgi:hypothetical protein
MSKETPGRSLDMEESQKDLDVQIWTETEFFLDM